MSGGGGGGGGGTMDYLTILHSIFYTYVTQEGGQNIYIYSWGAGGPLV